MGSNRREGTMELFDDASEDWIMPPEERVELEQPAPPEKKACPDCGKMLTWLADGSRPRKHKCVDKTPVEYPALTAERATVDQQQAQPANSAVTADVVIAKYVETRDEIATLQKEVKTKVAALKDLQDKRGLWLKGELDRLGLDSFKSTHGSCFFVEKSSATVADRQIFLDWVRDDWVDREGFLENRVSKMAVKQRLEDGDTLPPGVNYSTFKDVQIRRS